MTKESSSYICYVFLHPPLQKGILRGRPFDSEGGGLALLVGTDYLFSSRAWPENLFPGKSRTEYFFSTATHFFKKQKEGGVVSARVKKRGQDLAFHVLHNVLQTTCM